MNILVAIESLHGSLVIYSVVLAFTFFESLAVIGLAFPGTTLMIFVGYLVSRGKMNFLLAVLALCLGGFAGDIISFYLGRSGKKLLTLVEKFIKPSRLAGAEKFFNKYGVGGVAIHRFIGPLRPILPFAAGILKMRRRVFIPVDILSNFAAAIFYVAVGVFVGRRWRHFLALFLRYEKIVIIALLFSIALYIILSKRPKK